MRFLLIKKKVMIEGVENRRTSREICCEDN